jgi:hypothetical protein
MGTNYYHRFNICSECERYDERHIGKNSGGWEFSFRGYKDSEGNPIIVSWQDWKEILKAFKYGKIFDGSGNEWSYDDFVAKVEKTKGLQNHYDYTIKAGHQYMYNDFHYENWKDAEGWSFSSTEFC